MSVSTRVLEKALQLGALAAPPRVPARNGRDSRAEKPLPPVPETRVPRFRRDDYCPEIVSTRRNFVEEYSGVMLRHVAAQSFDPHVVQGNCEHFTGVAQVPLGIAGPLRVLGEHARGDFLVPLATSEGTLVASYNRGMHVLNEAGGVKVTVVEDAMQRAPVFIFEDARRGRDFVDFVRGNFEPIARMAETTSHVARLKDIEIYLANRFVYLRFEFHTGDAAGQNMVTKATYAACQWLVRHFPGVERFYLESNLATDKKPSQINTLHGRGKRVTAEAVIPREVMHQRLHVWPEQIAYHNQVANVGAFLSGSMNNGLHSANGITAMFIATGQDVANVAESCSAVVFTELTPERDLYISITLPSLIVASFGGGTGLPTQRECLEIMGCYGQGKARKLAEIVGGTVLAGELSLASAISSAEWVSSHERMGRNRTDKRAAAVPSAAPGEEQVAAQREPPVHVHFEPVDGAAASAVRNLVHGNGGNGHHANGHSAKRHAAAAATALGTGPGASPEPQPQPEGW